MKNNCFCFGSDSSKTVPAHMLLAIWQRTLLGLRESTSFKNIISTMTTDGSLPATTKANQLVLGAYHDPFGASVCRVCAKFRTDLLSFCDFPPALG
mmetsp:Transcript_1649/g.3804  ORF Transcript_1649/g.3804 Transcript_1649/m.3804 type:complete len:96 (-) Transcript_1649:457-744(-)